jgi:hypothetical protein
MAEHPKKLVKIIVEAVEHEWPKEEITYAEVVTLEDPEYPQHPELVYSVTYERAHGDKQGMLTPGGSVKVKDGMNFHVKDTGES